MGEASLIGGEKVRWAGMVPGESATLLSVHYHAGVEYWWCEGPEGFPVTQRIEYLTRYVPRSSWLGGLDKRWWRPPEPEQPFAAAPYDPGGPF